MNDLLNRVVECVLDGARPWAKALLFLLIAFMVLGLFGVGVRMWAGGATYNGLTNVSFTPLPSGPPMPPAMPVRTATRTVAAAVVLPPSDPDSWGWQLEGNKTAAIQHHTNGSVTICALGGVQVSTNQVYWRSIGPTSVYGVSVVIDDQRTNKVLFGRSNQP